MNDIALRRRLKRRQNLQKEEERRARELAEARAKTSLVRCSRGVVEAAPTEPKNDRVIEPEKRTVEENNKKSGMEPLIEKFAVKPAAKPPPVPRQQQACAGTWISTTKQPAATVTVSHHPLHGSSPASSISFSQSPAAKKKRPRITFDDDSSDEEDLVATLRRQQQQKKKGQVASAAAVRKPVSTTTVSVQPKNKTPLEEAELVDNPRASVSSTKPDGNPRRKIVPTAAGKILYDSDEDEDDDIAKFLRRHPIQDAAQRNPPARVASPLMESPPATQASQNSPPAVVAAKPPPAAEPPHAPRNPLARMASPPIPSSAVRQPPATSPGEDDFLWDGSDGEGEKDHSEYDAVMDKRGKKRKRVLADKNKIPGDPRLSTYFPKDDDDDDEDNGVVLDESKPEFDAPKFGPFDDGPLMLGPVNVSKRHQVPASISRYLPDYQREGIRFLYQQAIVRHMGAILGDGMFICDS